MVRALGREPRLRHRRRRAGARRARDCRRDASAIRRAVALARARARTPTAASARTSRSYRDRALARPRRRRRRRRPRGRCSRCSRPAARSAAVERGVAWLASSAASRRRLGRAASSPAPASRATSTSATTSTRSSSRRWRSAATCGPERGIEGRTADGEYRSRRCSTVASYVSRSRSSAGESAIRLCSCSSRSTAATCLRGLRQDPVPEPRPDEAADGRASASRAVDECGAPIVSIPGGEPLLHPRDRRHRRPASSPRKKYVYLCTNALLLEEKLDALHSRASI